MEDNDKVCEGSTLTVKELKELKKKIIDSLAVDRHQLLIKFPFMGNLLLRMELVPVRDKRCLTMSTDGVHIYVSTSFYSKLSTQERIFVLAHELFHCVLLHLTRCQTRIPEIYNIASDMEVNYCLSQQGSDMAPPKDLCYPPKSMQGKSAEVIYEWLMRKFKQQKKNGQKMQIPNGSYGPGSNSKGQNGSSSGSCGRGRSNQGQMSDDESYDDDYYGRSERDPNQCNGQGKNGKDTGNLEGQFDNHKFESDLDEQNGNQGNGSQGDGDADGDGNGNQNGQPNGGKGGGGKKGNKEVSDEYGTVGYDPDFTPHISKDFADKMREAVIAEAQRCQRTQGHLPAGLEGLLDKMPKPEIPWQDHLAAFVSGCFGDKRRWTPPARRHIYNEMYFQSRRSEKIKVAVIVDTSGSCWGDLNKFFSEMNSLLKTFGSYEMTVIQCDAAVQDITKYSDENPFPIDDPKAIDISGCGGSDFRPAFKALRDEGIEADVDCVLTFTDGYIDYPDHAPTKPLLIILTKDGNKECASYGKKIVFKNNSYDDEAM